MILAEYTTANGAKVVIDDSYAAKKSTREEQLAIEEQRMTAKAILTRYAHRQAVKEKKAV